MASAASQPIAPASFSFNDVLRILPSSARATLFSALRMLRSAPNARSACRGLQDLVDGQTRSININLQDRPPAELLATFHEGRWLERRPRCADVTLAAGADPHQLLVPLATAPLDACRRVTKLTIQCAVPIPGSVLLGLTSRLPGLTCLYLCSSVPTAGSALDRHMASYALSLPPNLTRLELREPHFLPFLPDSLAARLTGLYTNGEHGRPSRPTATELAAALSRMTALKEVELGVSLERPFTHNEARQILNAVPRGSLQSFTLTSVGNEQYELRCGFTQGFLDTVDVADEGPDVKYGVLSQLLATTVLRSAALGPRLRLIKLQRLEADAVPDPDPAANLYGRCDEIQVGELVGEDSVQVMISLVRRLGVPERITWHVGFDDGPTSVQLKERPHWWQAAREAQSCGSGGQRSRSDGSGSGRSKSGGSGSGSGGRVPAAPVPLSLPAFLSRAVDYTFRAPPGYGVGLVAMRGPLVRGLIAAPRALEAWLQQIDAEVTAAQGGFRAILKYRVLAAAGAVLAECDWYVADAVAAAARRLGEAAAEGGAGGGVVMVEAARSCVSWDVAVQQVLQQFWDGEEEGRGEGPDAGLPGGPAGQLERVRCLLETWDALRGIPDPHVLLLSDGEDLDDEDG